ncbi:MAG: AEC family transporter [Ardenticatenaceae bacterium]|nr:AEC family transporter [Anaerolineales bacterium]MCB8920564.1 AEC family transporter [Ardenticatenaceae bacterium]MCB8990187.1 AEC family transporter [Ardenticatenaceae bacterium]MCB9003022.1 AEC family transporter [Ardenticatenaceae bacterium]
MLTQLIEIFFNVITPVFGLVLLGYIAQPRLNLQAQTLSRFAYFLLIPAFVFNVISTAVVDLSVVSKMVIYILLVELATALLAFAVARTLRRPPQMVAAYVLIAVFANVGNFGLPLIQFRLGETAVLAATIYFLAIMTAGFIIGVAAASWHKGGTKTAVLAVFKTPALIAIVPAILFNAFHIETPLFASRMINLLAAAMIPTMLVTLGVQLASTREIKLTADTFIATSLRLLGGPLLAILLVIPFGLQGVERSAGIIQAAMPAAVLTAIIAMEHDLLPDYVTTAVLLSTIASVLTLTLILAFI